MNFGVILASVFLGMMAVSGISQESVSAPAVTLNPTVMDGTVILGYVDQGGFINFAGPGISFYRGPHKVILGMLPSLRLKRDPGHSRHPAVLPALGVGLTYSFGRLALQAAGYYQTGTDHRIGRWVPGLGAGIRLIGPGGATR
jgi:hypothetical protein